MKSLLLLPNFQESWESVKIVCQKTHELSKEQYGEDLDVLYVEREQIFKKSKSFLKYQRIICLDHSIETIQTLKFVKGILKEDLCLEFYALGMASSFYWPLKKWGLTEHLGKEDQVIVSCSRDRELTKLSLPQANCELRPFRFFTIHPSQNPNKNKLFYIGRLSFLKNIHGLISFFNNYRKENPQATLEFIGDWDNEDLPFFKMKLNREKSSSIYKDYINGLIEELKLGELVTFHGKKTQADVTKWLEANNGTFVSLSLQNDENYGLAADQSLAYGHQGILSDWGGHAQLKELFPSQVKLLKTFVSSKGPGIRSNAFREDDKKVLRKKEDKKEDKEDLKIALQTIQEIVHRREEFNQLKKGDVLFHDNTDPYYHFLCLKYSGKKEVEQREDGPLLFGCEDILKK